MWRPTTSALVLTAASASFFLFATPPEARAQHLHWCSCLWGDKGHRSSRDWASEAASLGVVGGAPALGFSGCVTGYERGIIRVPFPTSSADSSTSGGGPVSSSAVPGGTVPPPPLPTSTTPPDGRSAPPTGGLTVPTPPSPHP